MKICSVGVEVKKMLSDGDYGHESAQVSFSADVDDDEDVDKAMIVLLERARAHVTAHLQASESIKVRRSLNPPRRVCSECGEDLPDEVRSHLHPACDEKRQQERAAQRQQEREEHAAALTANPTGIERGFDQEAPF